MTLTRRTLTLVERSREIAELSAEERRRYGVDPFWRTANSLASERIA
jgi:hypothetical protein